MNRYIRDVLFFVTWAWLAVSPAVYGGTATLTWLPVTEDTLGHAESQPVYYNIYCDTVPAFVPAQANFLAATVNTQWVHTDARLDDPNRHLFYRVYAVDLWGNQSAVSGLVGETTYVLANLRVLLEAPYDVTGDSLSTRLRATGLLPLSSPYAQAPRRVAVIPPGSVDWVLLQLRDPTTATIHAQESFFIKKDGTLTEMDGLNPQLGFTGCEAGAYQIIVRHRNHVAVMSRAAVALSENEASLYDFSTDSSRYYGTSAARMLADGRWGLWCGDFNQDGLVTEIDYAWWLDDAQRGRSGYRPADLNGDNRCTTADYVMWYRTFRRGVQSHVP